MISVLEPSNVVTIREICNGIMFVYGIIVLGLFICYVVRQIDYYWDKPAPWYKDIAVQAAGALSVLILGHSIRAGVSWMEFLWSDLRWDPNPWIDTVWVFITATFFIVIGKLLIIYAFSSRRKRKWTIVLSTMAGIGIPVAVWAIANYWPPSL